MCVPNKVIVALLLTFATIAQAAAVESRIVIDETLAKPTIRGGIVYKNYCVLCHGENGSGDGRLAKIHGSNLLPIRLSTQDYMEKIIRSGGAAIGKSEYMPPWQDELSEEQISDVLAYLQILTNNARRGEVVFQTNCILCHGTKGDGKGRAAKLYNPPPADLTRSDKNDAYKENIIRYGGEAMGRSSAMPVWGEQLSDQEIKDLVEYLRILLVSN